MHVPPFSITDEIIGLISEISLKVGEIDAEEGIERNLTLRKVNRLKSVKSSLAIEGNTLSLDLVSDVIDGKNVLGPKREILEVKNASKAYDYALIADPFDIGDLLTAHGIMMRDLIPDAGRFREGNVGVFEGMRLIHMGVPPGLVSQKVDELMGWAKRSTTHMLVKSCVFHYELEFIHPFSDGNGRMGRLWHHILLSGWNPVFAVLPIETFVERHQKEYYDALRTSNEKGDSTGFVVFMLNLIVEALDDLSQSIGTIGKDGLSETERKVYEIISQGKLKTSAEIASMAAISVRTFTRAVSSLVSKGLVRREGSPRSGRWVISR